MALIVPGFFLMLRWFVVAQTAAIEHEGWLPALRVSRRLTKGHYGHIFVFAIYIGLIVTVPTLLIGFGFGHHSTTAASFLVGLVVRTFTNSFSALATALLYFDLRARLAYAAAATTLGAGTRCGRPAAGRPLLGSEELFRPRPPAGLVRRPQLSEPDALLGCV